MDKYSSVSSVIETTKQRMKQDRNLKERIDKLHEVMIKSQKQT
jgi:hypothetical protein